MCITKIYNIYVFIYLEYILSYLQANPYPYERLHDTRIINISKNYIYEICF